MIGKIVEKDTSKCGGEHIERRIQVKVEKKVGHSLQTSARVRILTGSVYG